MMRIRFLLLFIISIQLASLAGSFPLSGGDGQLNATVFGVIWGSTPEDNNLTDVYIDIAVETPLSETQLNCMNYTAVLLDEEGQSYQRADEICLGERKLLGFRVPKNDVIKQLRLEFEKGANVLMDWKPIVLIDWDNPPEDVADNLTMKFYGAKKSEMYYDGWRDWYFDVEFSNEGEEKRLIVLKDFAMLDQYGWDYTSCNLRCELPPGESIRFYVPIHFVSDVSLPTALKYGNLSIDISGWT